MRRLLASFLLGSAMLLLGGSMLGQTPPGNTQNQTNVHSEPSTYRGKPLSFYLTQVQP